jgi:hypothetical protein
MGTNGSAHTGEIALTANEYNTAKRQVHNGRKLFKRLAERIQECSDGDMGACCADRRLI